MTLTGREEEDQSSYFIKLKLANCRLLYYNFRTFLQGYVMAFFDQNTEDVKDPVFKIYFKPQFLSTRKRMEMVEINSRRNNHQ